jgi:5'-methylthioadenosine nucleosidase
VTSFSIQTLKPDLIINAGTAGGFKVCTRSLELC